MDFSDSHSDGRGIKRVLFLGSKNYGIVALKSLYELSPESLVGIVTLDDSGDNRSSYPEMVSFASANKIPLKIISKTSELKKTITAFSPDLCLTVGWFSMIPKDILHSVPQGFVGIHNSLLPALRGSAPFVWAIINGDTKAGITLFKFEDGIDNGDILASRTFPILPDDYIADLMAKGEKMIPPLLQEAYPKILKGSLLGIPQSSDSGLLSYGAPRRPMDGNIDWHKSALYIYNFIRAQSFPYPGAFTYHQDRKLILRRSTLFQPVYYGTPGQVAQVEEAGVYVICGDDRAVILEEIEVYESSGELSYRGNPNRFIKSISVRFSGMPQSLPVNRAGS